jgi:acetoin utilization protein AcuB
MLVRNWMSKKVITVDVDESMVEATRLLKAHNIRMLPVMKKGTIVGVVSDRDLKRASASDANTLEIHELLYLLTTIKIRDVMTKHPLTVPFDYTIEEAAEIMLKHKISGLPVVDHDGQLVGIITQSDIFRVIISLTGLSNRGIQFGFLVEDRQGAIQEITELIRDHGGRIASILTSYDKVPHNHRQVFMRTYWMERKELLKLLEGLKKKAVILYMIDLKDGYREIYEQETANNH